ncbi:MAG: HNH endonuclease [Oscillospiraceae bacterium]
MANSRRPITAAESELLFGQVGGICPICSTPLTYIKNGKPQKKYQIAHIYPLNPSTAESSLLSSEKRLSEDVNSLDNLIPLCPNCHTRFDKPRTVDEYRTLFAVKSLFIQEQSIKTLYGNYSIEDEIREIIKSLTTQNLGESASQLEYTALHVDDKLASGFDQILRKHIKDDVTQYYNYIKAQFYHIEEITPGKFDLVAGQIKTFYLNAKIKSGDQVVIFNKIAEWIQTRVGNCSLDACKVIVAFFIQNCEVFEHAAK